MSFPKKPINIFTFNKMLDKLGVTKNATEVSITLPLNGQATYTITGLVEKEHWQAIVEEMSSITKKLSEGD